MLACFDENEEIIGFLSLKETSAAAVEIYVMGVLPEFHRKGGGGVLVQHAKTWAREKNKKFLSVKTLAPSHPDPHYAGTRRFYEKTGFAPLEVFPALWKAETPCLILVLVL